MSMAAGLREHRRISTLVVLLALGSAGGGCDVAHMHLTGRATDTWTRTYPLAPGGQIEILNTNGKIDVEGADVEQVEVRAERTARAATDDAARDVLTRVGIKEDVTPEHIRLETGRMEGLTIGISYEVAYSVRAPRGAIVRVTNTNGQVTTTGMTGQVFANTTNGGVRAREMSGELSARSTNGGVDVELAALTARVSLQTTNGGVSLVVPDDAKADLSASCTNGGISVSGLKLETTESTRRRVEGKLNGGGALIDLRTTNGGIRVRSRSAPSA